MKKKLKRGLALIIILFCNFWLYTKIFWPSSFTDMPEIVANLYSKELCSCRYVDGLPRERCLENHRSVVKPTSLTWDDEHSRVRVRFLWAVNSAAKTSERYGCVRD